MQFPEHPEELLPVSVSMAEVLCMDPDFAPPSGEPDAGAIVRPDIALTAEILHVANMPYYRRSGRVSRLEEAIQLIGLRVVRNIAVLLLTRSLRERLSYTVLQKHIIELPVVTAVIARNIMRSVAGTAAAEDAFTQGLLQKLGMAVLATHNPSEYAGILTRSEQEGEDLTGLEGVIFGFDHVKVSQRIFAAWLLPESVRSIINYRNPEGTELSVNARILILADNLARNSLQLRMNYSPDQLGEMDASGTIARAVSDYRQSESMDNIKSDPMYQRIMLEK